MNKPTKLNQPQSVEPQHPSKLLWLYILIVILFLVSGFFGWSYFSNHTTQSGTATTGSTLAEPTATNALSAVDCEKYVSQNYGFSISFPKNYTHEEITPTTKIGGVLQEVVFTNKHLGDNYKVTITIADKEGSIEPDGMKPTFTKDMTISGLPGKNFDDVAYVVDNTQYRFRITVDGGADWTLKIMAKFIVNSFQFTS